MINLDLEALIKNQIEQIIKDNIDSAINTTLNESKIYPQIEKAIVGTIDTIIGEDFIKDQINQSVKKYTDTAIANIFNETFVRTQIEQVVKSYLDSAISNIIEKVAHKVQNEIDCSLQNLKFPESSIASSAIVWNPYSLSGSYISGGTIKDFSSTGIEDKSNNVQLTILDDHVVVEGEFTAMNLTAADMVTTKHLSLTGTLEIGTDIIDHGALAGLIQTHFDNKIQESLEPFNQFFNDGTPLVQRESLSNTIISSNLRKLGNLTELNVLGDAKFSETLYVSSNGRIGINTEEPSGALTIWDENAEVSFIKSSKKTMYIGSTRGSNLELGVNLEGKVIINEEGVTIPDPITFMGVKIRTSTDIPEGDGSPNEICYVLNQREDHPRFYVCLGGNKWKALG